MEPLLIRLQGAPNFRDIGGYPSGAGRRIKRAHIFRSGELSRLTDADFATLRRLGIRFVADLRTHTERDIHPSRLAAEAEIEFHHADITMDVRIGDRNVMELIVEEKTPEGVARTVAMSYGVIADLCGPALRLITERLSTGAGPLLFHCTNGRDRTGVIAAMLLYMLGASRDSIVADFMLTNERMDVEMVIANSLATMRKALGDFITREMVERVTLVQAQAIEAMFDSFAAKYGSPEGYLRHFGIDEAMVCGLREQLLEPG